MRRGFTGGGGSRAGRMLFPLPLLRLRPDVLHFEFGSLAAERIDLADWLGCRATVSFRGWDLNCLADQSWYQANQTQPDRDQPWYHVLVQDTDGTTYAAQDSLRVATDSQPIEHPLIGKFFSAFVDGRYIRNDRPWPRLT